MKNLLTGMQNIFLGKFLQRLWRSLKGRSKKRAGHYLLILQIKMVGGTILGISPGTKYIGVALFRGNDLYDWKIKTYRGVWSNEKLATVIQFIEETIISHVVNKIACKLPNADRTSKALNELMQHIKKTANEYGIEIYLYSVEEMKSKFNQSISNKMVLALHLLENFPELKDVHTAYSRSKHRYHMKVFEAIAVALHCH